MSTEGWIFMVGLRVFDVGALIVWLIWFYRQRDDDGGGDDGQDGGGGGSPPDDPVPGGPSGGDLELPRPDAEPWPGRRRDHNGQRDRPRDPIPRRPATPARPARRTPAR